jgi:hypothetical protein
MVVFIYRLVYGLTHVFYFYTQVLTIQLNGNFQTLIASSFNPCLKRTFCKHVCYVSRSNNIDYIKKTLL